MYQTYTPTELLSHKNIFLPPKNPIIQTKIDETKEKLYKIILQNSEKIDPVIREENIINANSHQIDLISKKMKSEIIARDHEMSRKLIAYYRNGQILDSDRWEIHEIMNFVRYYVESGFSPIYDEFGMVMRFSNSRIPDWFEHNFYDVENFEFTALTNIFADTIHISNGTPEGLPGTVNILGTTAYNRWLTKFENIVHLPLEYIPADILKNYSYNQEVTKTPDKKRLFTILPKVLESIRKAENLHLQNLVK